MTSPETPLPPSYSAESAPPHEALFEVNWNPMPDFDKSGVANSGGNLRVVLTKPTALSVENNEITGYVSSAANDIGLHAAHIDSVYIDREYRGHGIGSAMYKLFTANAIGHGATHIIGETMTADAVRVRMKLFGIERMTFFEPTHDDERQISLKQPISIEEFKRRQVARDARDAYLASLNAERGIDPYRPETFEDKDNDQLALLPEEQAELDRLGIPEQSYTMLIDLQGLDTADWEQERLIIPG